MNETGEVFGNQNILPAQFFRGRRDGGRTEPLRRLAFAVLVDAVHVFQLNFGTTPAGRKRQFNEARDWLLGRPGHGPFCFENVCYVLDIDPSGLRRWLWRWQAMKRAGQPCETLARPSPVNRIQSSRPCPPRRRASARARGIATGATGASR